ncbi:L-amino acid N-acyltransferase YncA [Poseidonocella pacifica]|uniref:L-amino acid N-acyltransferase YncA n=1 Tax=Poseidonocella pacifica TaxID=871651 RepID=A0A1I0VIA7_9RHOB|nr:GNAT family N-acetyltransferase [Poseidonocella pacifica]SFA76061.1 L-amino acid N-acyltransferase YncA [Poseidonocella pacifica]
MIRPARQTDATAVAAILSDYTDGTEWLPRVHSRAQDISHAAELIARGPMYVASETNVQGFIAWDGPRVQALYVAEAARGRGVGKALLDRVKQRHGWLTLWTLEANEGARRFYAREGFAVLARGTGNDEGLPEVQLLWERDKR